MAIQTPTFGAADSTNVRHGVLILAPAKDSESWAVLELEANVTQDRLARFDPCGAGAIDEFECQNAEDALSASREVLTHLTEGRVPCLRDHFVSYARRYVQEAEQRGHNRTEVVAQLMALLDTQQQRMESRLRA